MNDWNSYQKGSAALDADTAQRWLDQVVVACSTLDPEVISDLFTEDAVADLGEIIVAGKEKLRPLIQQRYGKYTRFDLQKKLRVVSCDIVVCDARLLWTSAEKPQLQHTRAIEILQVRDGRIARWDNATVSWPDATA